MFSKLTVGPSCTCSEIQRLVAENREFSYLSCFIFCSFDTIPDKQSERETEQRTDWRFYLALNCSHERKRTGGKNDFHTSWNIASLL